MSGIAAGLGPLLVLLLVLPGCGHRQGSVEVLRFWAMGREGEVVEELIHDFERENPGIRVIVQQIPWGAAHEKLLTAHVGGSTPDAAQLGNTWVAEFEALRAIEPLQSWIDSSRAVKPAAYFPGIWDTNVIDGAPYGVPWYVDTRVLFYRRDLLERAGFHSVPADWAGWMRCMEAVRRAGGKDHFAIFLPTNEYTPWIIFGLQAGSHLLKDDDTRGDFGGPAYRRAVDFYLEIFRGGLAPTIEGSAIGNLYQEFERGTFAMYITGPWNLGEFRHRLSPALQGSWATAPLPGPDGAGSGLSVAGGSSLVLFRASHHQRAAWKLIEFLSRPEQQLNFWRLTGDLPARVEAWRDSGLAGDPNTRAFEVQLTRAVPTPKIPEWEEISNRLQDEVGTMLLGHARPDSSLAALDRAVDGILEKRRWLKQRERQRAALAVGAGR